MADGSAVNDDTLPIGVCDCKCVIFKTKRAKYASNKEILYLLNAERACSNRASLYNSDEKSTMSV